MQYGSIEPIMPRKRITRAHKRTFTTKDYIYLSILIPFAFLVLGSPIISISILILMVGWKVIWF